MADPEVMIPLVFPPPGAVLVYEKCVGDDSWQKITYEQYISEVPLRAHLFGLGVEIWITDENGNRRGYRTVRILP